MSLINDALKKAQKSQTQLPETTTAAPVSARSARQPGAGMNLERILLLVVALVGVIVGATAVAVLLLRKDARPVAAQTWKPAPSMSVAANPPPFPPVGMSTHSNPTAPHSVTVPTPAPKGPPAVESSSAPVVTVASIHPPAPPVSQPPPVPATAPVSPAPIAAPVIASVEATPPAAQPAPPAPAPPQDPLAERRRLILSFIENARVAGVRMAGDDSKVLMNDHVYRLNTVVNMELGLRLTAVTAEALTFVDENGIVFTKAY